MRPWPFFHDGRHPSQRNMDTDRRLFSALRRGEIPGFFRVYNWSEPAVTVGYHQRRFSLPEHVSLPVLTRPTGGGAVLHGDDFTFSLGAPCGFHLPSGIAACTSAISGVFSRALSAMGVETHAALAGRSSFSSTCFAQASASELTAVGAKVLGLALRRQDRFMLVQGVIPLRVDHALAREIFGDAASLMRGIVEIRPDFDPMNFTYVVVQCLADMLRVDFSSVAPMTPSGVAPASRQDVKH